jgi:hypothetical protein
LLVLLLIIEAAVERSVEPVKKETSPKINTDNEERLKKRIAEMLREPTGGHFLDSGSAYGRKWQKNQHRCFEEEPAYRLFIAADDAGKPEEIFILYDLYHYLIRFLSLDDSTDQLNRLFRRFSNTSPMKDESRFTCMEAFLKTKLEVSYSTNNTYNYSNALSQVIQYATFRWGEESSNYIILQIHNGCDVRGGYTNPHIFKVEDKDDFYLSQFHVEAWCTGKKHDLRQTSFEEIEFESTCHNRWSSCDAGIHYHFHGSSSETKPIEEYTRYDKQSQKLTCTDCGSEIAFSLGDHG